MTEESRRKKQEPAEKQRSGGRVMLGLIGMVRPLIGIMLIAIIMGCIGNLMATFITILGGVGLGTLLGFFSGVSLKAVLQPSWSVRCCAAYCAIRSRRAIIILPLNCWQESVIRYLRV